MGAVKAINAARLSMSGDGVHRISLDQVIATMKRTGADMLRHYNETSLRKSCCQYSRMLNLVETKN